MDSYSILLSLGFFFCLVVLYLQLVRRRRARLSSAFDAFMVMMLGLAVISFAAAAMLHGLQGHHAGSAAPMGMMTFVAEHPVLLLALGTTLSLAAWVAFVMMRQDRPSA